MPCKVNAIRYDGVYWLDSSNGLFSADSLVIASGGLSIPQIGATRLWLRNRQTPGLNVTPLALSLVPLTFAAEDIETTVSRHFAGSHGVVQRRQLPRASADHHRGLSGPAIPKISNYWHPGDWLEQTCCRMKTLAALLLEQRRQQDKLFRQLVSDHLGRTDLPWRGWESHGVNNKPLRQHDERNPQPGTSCPPLALSPQRQMVGYKKAEVTRGGGSTLTSCRQKPWKAKTTWPVLHRRSGVDVTLTSSGPSAMRRQFV